MTTEALSKPTAAFFWRKLDHPGHDSCRLFRVSNGWRLSGAAVFWDDGRPCHFHYEVMTDAAWRSRRAKVAGFLGNERLDLRISSIGNTRWRVAGKPLNSVTGCIDVDLGFTPATNLIAIRRLSLKVGQYAEAPAAYLANHSRVARSMSEATEHSSSFARCSSSARRPGSSRQL